MNSTTHLRPSLRTHPSGVEVTSDAAEAASVGLRIAEVGVALFVGLLVCPPLLILVAVVSVALVTTVAVVGVVVAVVGAPIFLVRRVRAHHRGHGAPMFLRRRP